MNESPFPPLPDLSDAERVAQARALAQRLAMRRTCRAFADTPVPREVIEQAIAAAGTAPSGANHQPWHFVAISDPATKRAIRLAAEEEERDFYAHRASEEWLGALAPLGTDPDKPFLEIAPWLIVCFAQRKGGIEEDGRMTNYYVTESVGIACGMLLATLNEAGLATLTHTPSPMGFLREICGRPEHEKPLMIVVAGLPSAEAAVPDHALRKKGLSRIASWI
ncbi:nitroreductase family protein [Aurantiacibacter luteus]|uniref:Nitroreductase n=1 Tax=Aurantiacibacter luteus TaxID=1581420 RepID=A0A0G9MY34_9SPHN|nr:nitroreductase family protein [Aurantiacibacter luteus]KLE35621.1 nitroreductase [Aurantiacibacter luteus]